MSFTVLLKVLQRPPPRTLILLSPDYPFAVSYYLGSTRPVEPKLLSVLSVAWEEAAGHQTQIAGITDELESKPDPNKVYRV